MEVIDHQRRVGQDVADGGGVATERVDRRHLDPVHPLPRPGGRSSRARPGRNGRARPRAGGPGRCRRTWSPSGCAGGRWRAGTCARRHRARRRRSSRSSRGDQRVAVVDDGLMGAGPADPERPGRLGDGVELLADTSADLPAGPLRQRRPRRDVRRRLRPRPTRTRLLAAAPRALRPHQHRRHPGDRQVPHAAPAGGRCRSLGPRSPDTTPDRPSSPPPATARHRDARAR